METVTLILHLEATTNINPSDSSEVTAGVITGATEGATSSVTEGALLKQDRATDSATITQC